MIKTLSPYYINVPLVSPLTGDTALTYTINLFIWSGSKASPPSEPTYQITKSNPTASTGFDKINIARLVNDFIEFKPNLNNTTELSDGNNQIWIRQEIEYNTGNNEDNGELQFAETFLAVKGYGYGLSGENPQLPTNKILLPIQDYKVNRNGKFVIPILIDEPTDSSEIVITDITEDGEDELGIEFTIDFTPTNLYVRFKRVGSINWGVPSLLSGITSPQTLFTFIGTQPLLFQLFAMNETTGNVIYSNQFTFTPTPLEP